MDSNIKKMPLVSVTICTYNRANFIKQAIQSALDQTYSNMEIVVIDDASTDNTFEVIQSIHSPHTPILYFKNKNNLGLSKSRNKSIEQSSGSYIAILDSDDYWTDNLKIQSQVDFLESNPTYALVGTGAEIIDENNIKTGTMTYNQASHEIKDRILVEHQFVHSSVMYRKSVIESMGMFSEMGRIFEDYDLILRIGRVFDMANLPSRTTAYRKHSNNISSNLSFKSKILYLMILLRNIPHYPHRIESISRRLKL